MEPHGNSLMTFAGLEAQVAICDPPWRFSNKATRASADDHYPTLSDREILRLPVERLLAPTSAIFLWVTATHLQLGLDCLEEWGFNYKQTLVWVKVRNDVLQIGLGNYFRHAHELVLFATRGKFKFPDGAHDLPTVFWAPRGKHSSKPSIVHQWAEQIAPAGPRIELFAREARPGWSLWGLDAPAVASRSVTEWAVDGPLWVGSSEVEGQ